MNKSNLLLNVMMLITGIILVILHNQVNLMSMIVVIIGLSFIIPAIYSLVDITLKIKKEKMSRSGLITAVGTLMFGLFLIIKSEVFVGILAYLFAFILIVSGVYHIVFLLITARQVKLPKWFYILPSLIVIAGGVILFTSVKTLESVVAIITGISFITFSFSSLLEYFSLRKIQHIQR